MRSACTLLVLSALVLAGCGERVFDADKIESELTKRIEEAIGAQVKSVTCPEEKPATEGATLSCEVVGEDGTKGAAIVTAKAEDDDTVSLSVPFLHPRELATQIGDDLKKKYGTSVQLECPEILEARKGDTFDCEGTADGDPIKVRVTQKDDKANVRYEVVSQ